MLDKGSVLEYGRAVRQRSMNFLVAGLFGLTVLPMFGCAPPATPITPRPVVATATAEATANPDAAFYATINRGTQLRSGADKKMLDTTILGVDMAYSSNPAVKVIRAISDPLERILTAIGWLRVDQSGRYNNGVWACNGYAIDLATLLLGNKDIGSRYHVATGLPTVAGFADRDKWVKDGKTITQLDSIYPFLHANNFSRWAREYGVKNYNWIHVKTQQELVRLLKTGKYIGVGATKMERLKSHGGDVEIGHMYVYFNAGNWIGLSQATHNVLFEKDGYDSKKPKFNPDLIEYDFFLHPIPPADNP